MAVSSGSFFEKNRKIVGLAAGAITLLCVAFIAIRLLSSDTVVIKEDPNATGVQWKKNLMSREQDLYWQLANLSIQISEDGQSVAVSGNFPSDDDLKKIKAVIETIEPKAALKSVDLKVVRPGS